MPIGSGSGTGNCRTSIVGRILRAVGAAGAFSCLLAFGPIALATEIDDTDLAVALGSFHPIEELPPVAGDRDAEFDFPHVGIAPAEVGPPNRSRQPLAPNPPLVRAPLPPVAKRVSDRTAPRPILQVSSPGPRAKGSRSIKINTVDDDPSIEGVILIDDVIVASFSASSFTYEWDTTHVADGAHVLAAKVEDSSGNVGMSSPVTVNVNDGDTAPPSVYVAYPASGTNVYSDRVVNITASASDNLGISRVDFYVDTTRICSVTSMPYSCAWQVPDGTTALQYRIRVQAFDSRGNTASSSVTVFPPSGSSRVAAKLDLAAPPKL
jgi:hypothetical protein